MGLKTFLCNAMNPLLKHLGYTIVKNEKLVKN